MKTNHVLAHLALLCAVGCGGIVRGQDMPPAPSWTGDKDKDVQARLLWENLKPINEFVRVVDQYGNPVPGADVTGYVHLNVNFVYDTVEEHTTKTDSDGLFSFTGLHGKGLGWSVTKAGYEGSPNAVALTGPKTGKQSTAKDRITYVMWKQNPEAMVYRKFRPIAGQNCAPKR